MRQKSGFFWLLLAGLLLFPAVFSAAQENVQAQFVRRFQNGTQFYGLSRWHEAAAEFRRAQESAATLNDWSQAIYWVILSELAYSDYGSALRDMQELDKYAPNSPQSRDMIYHRARVYFNQGYFEDALFLFNRFIGSLGDTDRESMDRRAAGFFWMGECLYSMGQYGEAEKFYAWVVARYPQSPKIQAAAYRIDLITQKKIEAELLALLQWSHEESLRTSEDYQRKIRTYEYTLNLYQRRITELTETESFLNQDETFETPPTDTPAENDDQQNQIEEPIIPASFFSTRDNLRYDNDGRLIEKAIYLGGEVQQLLRDSESGGAR